MKLSKQLMLGLFCLTLNLAPLAASTQDEAELKEEATHPELQGGVSEKTGLKFFDEFQGSLRLTRNK